MQLPRPRGALSEQLVRRLRAADRPATAEPTDEEDLQLSLWMLYALHYRGFDDVDDREEWAPDLIGLRAGLERRLEDRLRALPVPDPGEAPMDALRALVSSEDQQRPRLASYLGAEATREQFVEFLQLRSVYHLGESDPVAFGLPRLAAGPKAGLAEILYDEFGDGRPERVHQQLFADALESLDLDPSAGPAVDQAPAELLAEVNVMSLLGLHRRLRGALLGHLAAFEATSSVPCRFVATGARRLGLPDAVARYYDEHVEADAVHEQVALDGCCGALLAGEPALAGDVLMGAAACLHHAERSGEAMLSAWSAGRSALFQGPVAGAA